MKRFIKSRISFLVFSALLIGAKAFAAACCGGGFATPSLINGDEKALLTGSYAQGRIDTDVYSSGIWRKRRSDDVTQTYKLEGAHILNDRYQVGFSAPLVTRRRSGDLGGTSTGWGDIVFQAGYEVLPDWDYSPWRPHGVGFLTLTLPTGKSVYESNEDLAVDSQGRGFFALGAGLSFTKSWTRWDANSMLEIHRAFNKTVHHSQVDGTVKPGTGESLSLGAGYNLRDLRLGGSLSWVYEDAIAVTGENSSSGSPQRYATGTLLASYVWPDDGWAGTLSYADQTWFGAPSNTVLSKTVSVSLQRRWSR